jgi:hypothetical protein
VVQALKAPARPSVAQSGVVQPLIVTIGAYILKTEGTKGRNKQDILINSIEVLKNKYGDQKDTHLEKGSQPLAGKGWNEDLIINAHGNPKKVGGMDASTLAQALVSKGYQGGGKIVLSACKSAEYALALAQALKENHKINVEVVGALAPVRGNSETVRGYGEKGWQSSKVYGTENAPLLGTKKVTTNNNDSLCFLTTACTAARGLADDCCELEALRRFRDEELLRWSGGPEAVELYYELAPQILDALEDDPERETVFEALYNDLVVPCVADIQAGAYTSAYLRYQEVVHRLFAERVLTRLG